MALFTDGCALKSLEILKQTANHHELRLRQEAPYTGRFFLETKLFFIILNSIQGKAYVAH